MAGISTATGEVRPLVERGESSASAPSRRHGRYVLGELLGRGGMAEVFAGHAHGSHGFQKPVAIKRLLPELANDEVFVERLIGEAKLLVGMAHGNIVSVLDLARDGDDVFLVMEYVDGPSLRQLLKARGTRGLALGVATYIVQAAAAGLESAHARPGGAIIHADISPSNLLLTTSGEVRVADFGIARREGGGAGVVEGKWAYMAPEQARGEPLTPRCDVFALGVVLYELITGQHPLGRQVTAGERDSGPIRIVPPRIVNPSVPAGLDAICMRALADHARDRYARMQHLIDALGDERYANGWREGASDLAQAIREITPGAASPAPQPRTQYTDRPVTIVTRSLISQPARGSLPRIAERPHVAEAVSASVSTAPVSPEELVPTSLVPPSGAQTSVIEMSPVIRLSAALLPSPELASVHGGHTFTGAAIDVRGTRGSKGTIAVLGVAALLGVTAAVAIQLAPSPEADPIAVAARPAAPVVAPRAPVVTPIPEPAPPPVLEPTVPASAASEPIEATVPESTVPEPTVERSPAPVRRARPNARTAGKPATKSGEAVLRVNTTNGVWAWAYAGSVRQDAPGAKFKLAAGKHVIKLKNTDLAVTRSCTVTLEPGQVRTLTVEMEEGGCDVR